MSRRPTVYLIAQPTVSRTKKNMNLDPLYEHGDLKVILPTGDAPAFSPSRCMHVMASRFQGFNPDTDFLVWAGGDTLAALLVGMLLMEREVYRFQWLRYERKRLDDGSRTDEGAAYVPITVDLRDPQIGLFTHEDDDGPYKAKTA